MTNENDNYLIVDFSMKELIGQIKQKNCAKISTKELFYFEYWDFIEFNLEGGRYIRLFYEPKLKLISSKKYLIHVGTYKFCKGLTVIETDFLSYDKLILRLEKMDLLLGDK